VGANWLVEASLRYRFAAAGLVSLSAVLGTSSPGWASPGQFIQFEGICNASAGVALTDDLFVVADDEDKVFNKRLEIKPLPFRLYSLTRPGPPIQVGELPGLDLKPEIKEEVSGELDLEASAPLEDVVFWIGSHSTGDKAAKAPNRRRLFAVRFRLKDGQLNVDRVGHVYQSLLKDLAKDHRYAQFNLKEAAKLDSKVPGGLSIEGMTALPGEALLGRTLAIGLRNPVPNGKALVITMLNPMQVIAGGDARFGDPIQLDLGGQGIRSMDTIGNSVLIVGGPAKAPENSDKGSHRLYRWSGKGTDQPLPMNQPNIKGLFVEAVFPVGKTLMFVSDDGKLKLPKGLCQDLDKKQQGFRAFAVPLP